jgi:DNA-binding CsgD family transcriptional regulator
VVTGYGASVKTRTKAAPALLVGRDDDLAQVEQLVDGLRAGSGGCLLLVGEPGSGKTALVRHAQARADGLTVLASQGLPSESDLPYAGLHRLLHPVAGRADTVLEPRDGILLADAMRLPAEADLAPNAVAAATLRFLQVLAEQQPVLVTVDNLDALDAESRAVVGFLIGRTGQAPVALIGTARDEAVALGLPDAPTQHLLGLDEPAVAELLAAVTAVPAAAAVRSALTAATRGNPRALVELAALLTVDQLRGVELLPDPVPLGSGTEWAYAGPVRALPEQTRRALLLAAAGADLDTAALSRAADEFGTSLSALVAAEDAGLVSVDLTGVSFAHPLIRSASYYVARASDRRAAHEVIARACPDQATVHRAAIAREPCHSLAAELSDVSDRVRAARGHAAAADLMQRSAELSPVGPARTHRFYLAASDAWLGGDPGRAIALLDQSGVDADPDDAVAAASVDLLRAQIMLRCGNVIDAYETLLAAATRFEGHSIQLGTRALVAAGMAAWVCGDLARFRRAARRAGETVGDRADELPPAVRVGLDYLTGLAAQFVGRLDDAAGPLKSVVDAALRVDNPSALVLAAACAVVGNDRMLVHGLATRALTAARDTGATAVIPHAIEILTLVETWSGRYPLTDPYAFEGLHIARQTGQSNSESHLLAMLAVAAAINGHTEECHHYARAADKIARRHSAGLVTATAELAMAMLDVVHARWTPAYQRLGKLFRAVPGAGHPVVALNATPYFVEAAALVGRPEKGQKVLDMYEQWAHTANRSGMLAMAARCRALLADGAEADKHYREAIRHHHRSDRDFERAYTELLYARYLRRNRQRAEAREQLHSAEEVFERLELSLWTTRVRAELRAVGERDESTQSAQSTQDSVPDRTLGGSGLTPQQMQIARLIAEGATNREVAERMFVSPRTVDYHLRNIFQRLSINSRAELIRRFG